MPADKTNQAYWLGWDYARLLSTLLASEFSRQLLKEQRANNPRLLHEGIKKVVRSAISTSVLCFRLWKNLSVLLQAAY